MKIRFKHVERADVLERDWQAVPRIGDSVWLLGAFCGVVNDVTWHGDQSVTVLLHYRHADAPQKGEADGR